VDSQLVASSSCAQLHRVNYWVMHPVARVSINRLHNPIINIINANLAYSIPTFVA
jgi:hypothetical protein